MTLPEGHAFPYDTDPLITSAPDTDRFLVIPRRDIERRDVLPLLGLLTPWATSTSALLNLGSSLVPVVDGYNTDPRDLDQIPEIRAYFEDLEAAWPYLPYFLVPDEPNQLLYWMLVGGGHRSPDGSRRTIFTNTEQVKRAQLRFMEETATLLRALAVEPGSREMEPLDAACRQMADMLETARPFLRTVD